MNARIGVITFPGSLDDKDAARAVRRAGGTAVPLWHGERDLRGVDAVVGEVAADVVWKRFVWLLSVGGTKLDQGVLIDDEFGKAEELNLTRDSR